MDQVTWSGTDYTIQEFLDLYRHRIPILVMTTSGYSGCDELLHQIGSDEVYWIYGIQKQKRLVVTQNNTNYLSIPMDYPLDCHIMVDNRKSTPVSLHDALEKLSLSADSMYIMFENNPSVSINIGADSGKMVELGRMEIIDSYEEKYLLARSVFGYAMYPMTFGIPVYLDINLDVATGCKYGDDEQFQKWISGVNTIGDSYESSPIKMCQDIIMFHERPASGHYEYIRPSGYATAGEGHGEDDNDDHDYADVSSPTKSSSVGDDKPALRKKSENEYSYTYNGKNTQQESGSRGTSVKRKELEQKQTPLPPLPRRPQPKIPEPHRRSSKEDLMTFEPAPSPRSSPAPQNQTNSTSKSKHPPPLLPPRNSTSKAPQPSPKPEQADEYVNGKSIEMQKHPPTDLAYVPPTPATSATHSSSKSTVSRGGWKWKDASEVPPDVQIENFTTNDVAECLQLLDMGQFGEIFQQKSIDGALLLCMDEGMLQRDFNFTEFDARKLMLFAKKRWRPNKR